jgi:hypothetical protein
MWGSLGALGAQGCWRDNGAAAMASREKLLSIRALCTRKVAG